MGKHRIRWVKTEGTVSYQLGHYEMRPMYNRHVGDFRRRSVFKVEVHLGEHPTVEAALSAWPNEIQRLRVIGRENKAEKLQAKLEKLRELTKGD